MPFREHARRILDAAVAAADARAAVLRALRIDGDLLRVGGAEDVDLRAVKRILLIGAGKAAARMGDAALEVLGDRIAAGTITVPDGCGAVLPRVEVWEAAHPVPDTRGMAGAVAALELARAAGEGDLVLCLLSGGASALWPAPPHGISLAALRATTDALLRSGADIGEVNTVRKHLSRLAGGQLARAAAPARVVTLAVSDVLGDVEHMIGSGPTVPDPTTHADALDVLQRRDAPVPSAVRAHLAAGAAGEVPETPKPGDPAFARASMHVVARNRDALAGAVAEAGRLGYAARIYADDVEGEARGVGEQVAALARNALAQRPERPVALVLGGETTVTVRGPGRGGRSQELALAAGIELEGSEGVLVAAMGTDGRDGATDAAGAFADGGTVARGRERGLDASDSLRRNDSHAYLRATGGLIVTGPPGTNVNDVIVVLVDAAAGG